MLFKYLELFKNRECVAIFWNISSPSPPNIKNKIKIFASFPPFERKKWLRNPNKPQFIKIDRA